MSERTVVDLAELRAAVSILLDHLSDIEGTEVALEHDLFWSVATPAIFDVYERPEDLSIGQLSESWENLRRMAENDRPLAYGLVWLGDLLRAIGMEIVR
jgi:hypothetical protein